MKGMDIFHIILSALSLSTQKQLGKRRSDARLVNKGRPPSRQPPSSPKKPGVQG